MTVTPADAAQETATHTLSPLQRAALRFPLRPVRYVVEVPDMPPRSLVDRVVGALAVAPEMGARLQEQSGLRLPRQRPEPSPAVEQDEGGWQLTAGTLRVSAEATEAGTRLTVEVDALFADVRSVELFLARVAGEPAAVAESDFFAVAAGHAAMAQEGELDQEARYWQQVRQRHGVDARSALGAEPGRPGAPVSASALIDSDTEAALDALAGQLGVSVSDILYLALAILAQRVSRDDVLLGRLADVRELIGMESASGPYSQVLPDVPAVDLGDSPRAALGSQAERFGRHAEMAGGAALGDDDGAAPTVIFDPCLDQRAPAGWRTHETFAACSGALVLRGHRQEAGLRITADGCEGEDQARLGTVVRAWAAVVAGIVRNVDAPCRVLELQSDGDLMDLGRALDASQNRPPAEDLCVRVHELAKEDEGAVAVRHGDRTLSRAGLLRRIGSLHGRLVGLAPGAVVAVLSEPETDLVAAWLAVLWGGGVVLPLSTAEPRARIEEALRDANAEAVLVGSGAPEFTAPEACLVLRTATTEGEADELEAPSAVGAQAPAYLLRTSGSTGKPKLVEIRRGSLNNYLRWVRDDVLRHDEDLPMVSSPVFDACLKQLLGPQYAGRATWLLEAERGDVAEVHAELARAGRPFSLNCVPSFWSELLDVSASQASPLPLRRLLLGGERVSDALLRRTADRYPEAEVWNLYGPTEATATATAGRLAAGAPVGVGTPVAGASVVIVDRQGHPVPPGMRGEVCIAGPGLAVGYRGLESSGFGPLSVGGRTFEAYRTGDLGRLGAAGELYVSGRIDDQVKLNGWRVEPAEIERVSERVTGVSGAAVVLDDREVPHRLRLFVVGDADADGVLDTLRTLLPAPLLPASVTVLDHFPLTTTGKRDRRRLLDSVTSRAEFSPDDYDDVELAVATAWRQVLGSGWPHPDEEFFSVGGHSLLLARLVNLLRTNGHESLSLRQVLRRPTVGSIARLVRGGTQS